MKSAELCLIDCQDTRCSPAWQGNVGQISWEMPKGSCTEHSLGWLETCGWQIGESEDSWGQVGLVVVMWCGICTIYLLPAAWLNQCRLSIAFVICSDATEVILSGLFANLRVPCLIEGRCHTQSTSPPCHTTKKRARAAASCKNRSLFDCKMFESALHFNTHTQSISQSFRLSVSQLFTHSVSHSVIRAIHLHALFFATYSSLVSFFTN